MSILRFRTAGRGERYTVRKGVLESIQRIAYTVPWGGWLGHFLSSVTTVETSRCRLEVLPEGAEPRRLCFLSDLHFGPTTARRALDRAFEIVAEQRPDALLLGGDYVFLDATRRRVADLRERIAALDVPVKLAVLGNHDLWADDRRVSEALEAAGVQVLCNEWVRPRGVLQDLVFVGIDDPWAGAPDVSAALRDCPDDAVRIGICHSPEILPELFGTRLDLLVCGHTHGGQIAIPRDAPCCYQGRWGKQFIAGEFQLEDFRLYVSRGIGTVSLPVRLFSRPEVVCVDLVGARAEPQGDNSSATMEHSSAP